MEELIQKIIERWYNNGECLVSQDIETREYRVEKGESCVYMSQQSMEDVASIAKEHNLI